jgi:hypothetical protein
MKMDATQKKRMWKVAIMHFLLSCYAAFVTFKFVVKASGFSGLTLPWLTLEPHFAWTYVWGSIWTSAFCFLQPHFWFEYQLERAFPFSHFLNILSNFPNWLVTTIMFLSIPVCSFCSSWMLVKFDHWLNHFPVLGRRVF